MLRCFIIPGSNGAELLQFTEAIFDQMTGFIQMSIIEALHRARAFRRNHDRFSQAL